MQHVKRETAERLIKAGWKKETESIWACWNWLPVEWELEPWCVREDENVGDWLPAPTLCEIVGELSWRNLVDHFGKHLRQPPSGGWSDFLSWDSYDWERFSEWLYTILISVEKAAEVWIKVKGKEAHGEE